MGEVPFVSAPYPRLILIKLASCHILSLMPTTYSAHSPRNKRMVHVHLALASALPMPCPDQSDYGIGRHIYAKRSNWVKILNLRNIISSWSVRRWTRSNADGRPWKRVLCHLVHTQETWPRATVRQRFDASFFTANWWIFTIVPPDYSKEENGLLERASKDVHDISKSSAHLSCRLLKRLNADHQVTKEEIIEIKRRRQHVSVTGPLSAPWLVGSTESIRTIMTKWCFDLQQPCLAVLYLLALALWPPPQWQ